MLELGLVRWPSNELELVRWPGDELELVRWPGDEPPSQDDDNQATGGRHLTLVIIATTGWQPVQVSSSVNQELHLGFHLHCF